MALGELLPFDWSQLEWKELKTLGPVDCPRYLTRERLVEQWKVLDYLALHFAPLSPMEWTKFAVEVQEYEDIYFDFEDFRLMKHNIWLKERRHCQNGTTQWIIREVKAKPPKRRAGFRISRSRPT